MATTEATPAAPIASAPTPPPRSCLRRWLFLLVANLLIVVIILEIGLRILFHDTFPPRFFEANADMGHFHVPGRSGWQHTSEYDVQITINDQGLRDRSHPYEKPDGVFRILIIGDSFVEGFQVAQDTTFEARLEAQLNTDDSSSPRIEVINGGVSRYGTDNALLFLENEGLKYQPDLVMYAFYPNDVTDNIEKNLFHLESGELVQQPGHVTLLDRVRGALYDVSYLYRFGLAAVIQFRQQTDETLIDTDWGRVLPIYRATLLPREVGAWNLTAALLDRMETRTGAAGAELLIVYLPEIYQSEDVLWAQVEQSSETLRRDAPNTSLQSRLPAGAHYLDLSPEFRARAQDTVLYYPDDGHFNAAGHQLAADVIQTYLIAENLIPRE